MAKGLNAVKVTENDKWQAEDDMRTLMRAKEVENDPKRFKAAKEMAKKKLMEMAAVAGSEE